MNKLYSSRLAHLPKHGVRAIVAVALLAVALVFGAFSFAPAAHAATSTTQASSTVRTAAVPAATNGQQIKWSCWQEYAIEVSGANQYGNFKDHTFYGTTPIVTKGWYWVGEVTIRVYGLFTNGVHGLRVPRVGSGTVSGGGC